MKKPVAPSFGSSHAEFSARTRENTWRALTTQSDAIHSILIIGGGIVGAALLRELALHDVPNILLIEKGDYASGTSGASSKLIHAGIRYLEQSWVKLKKGQWKAAWDNFRFVFDASRERGILTRIAPHLVKAKPIFLTLGKEDPRPVIEVAAGVCFYYALQCLQGQFFALPHFYLSKQKIAHAFPEMDSAKIKAVLQFWDSETDDARLVIETLQDANDRGGQAMNYVELVGFEALPSGLIQADIQNNENGERARVRCRCLVNAAGAHVDDVRRLQQKARSDKASLIDRVAGSHVDVYPALSDRSFYITTSDERLVFILRRQEDGLVYSRVGTTERVLSPEEASDRPQATAGEVAYLVEAVRHLFPQAELSEKTMISSDAGIRPLRAQQEKAFAKSREHDILVEGGLVDVVGVKLTDHRRVAEELIGKIPWSSMGMKMPTTSHPSSTTPLRAFKDDSLYSEKTIPDLLTHTMALHWDDVVWRRWGLKPRWLQKKDPGKQDELFEEMARSRSWTDEQRQKEKARARL